MKILRELLLQVDLLTRQINNLCAEHQCLLDLCRQLQNEEKIIIKEPNGVH